MGTWKALITTIAFAGVWAIFWLLIFEKFERQSILPQEPLFQVQNNTFKTQSINSETGLCNDTVDNDWDGYIDCSDIDCSDAPVCETCLYSTKRDADTIRLAQGESYAICYCWDGILQTKHDEQCEQSSDCEEWYTCNNCGCIADDITKSPITIGIVSNANPVKLGDTIAYKINITNRSHILQENIKIKTELEPYMQFVESQPRVQSYDDQILLWTWNSLDPKEELEIELLLKVDNTRDQLKFWDSVVLCVMHLDLQATKSCWRIPYID